MNKIRMFTDGACSGNPGPGGYAYIVSADDGCKKDSGGKYDTTNNEMELMAMVKGLKFVLENFKHIKVVEITTDSSYVISGATKWVYYWKENGWVRYNGKDIKNVDLWIEYEGMVNRLPEDMVIVFKQVKGHSGDYFNELVDKMAKAEYQKLKMRKEVKEWTSL